MTQHDTAATSGNAQQPHWFDLSLWSLDEDGELDKHLGCVADGQFSASDYDQWLYDATTADMMSAAEAAAEVFAGDTEWLSHMQAHHPHGWSWCWVAVDVDELSR